MAAAVGLTPAPSDRPGRPARSAEPVGDLTELGLPAAARPDAAARGRRPVTTRPAADRTSPSAAGGGRWSVAVCVVVAALLAAGIAWAVAAKVFTPSSPVPRPGGPDACRPPRAAATAAHLDVRVAGRTLVDHRARRRRHQPAADGPVRRSTA